MKLPREEIIRMLRQEYPAGCRVELVKMDDPQAPPPGTQGTVVGVDAIGSIMVNWDNGGSLSVAWGEDIVRKVEQSFETISFDPSDLKAMRELMERYAEFESMLSGENEDGEPLTLSIDREKITTVTLQENGWVRVNVYHFDGTREELFDGKWR